MPGSHQSYPSSSPFRLHFNSLNLLSAPPPSGHINLLKACPVVLAPQHRALAVRVPLLKGLLHWSLLKFQSINIKFPNNGHIDRYGLLVPGMCCLHLWIGPFFLLMESFQKHFLEFWRVFFVFLSEIFSFSICFFRWNKSFPISAFKIPLL